MRALRNGLLLLGLLACAGPAAALCVLCSCSASTTAVAFGGYNPLSGSATDSSGNVRVTCGGALAVVSYSVALSTGSYASNFSPRKMGSGANRLAYNLYTSAARSTIWGDGSGGSQEVADALTIVLLGGTSADLPVYGRIPASQTSTPAGTYTDTVAVTVTYN